jgi:hypothetical protein
MNEPRGPGAGGIVAGIFLILFGLCLTLLGGGCTIMWVSAMSSAYSGGAGEFPLLLLSFVTLGAGISLIWLGVKLMTGGFNKP